MKGTIWSMGCGQWSFFSRLFFFFDREKLCFPGSRNLVFLYQFDT